MRSYRSQVKNEILMPMKMEVEDDAPLPAAPVPVQAPAPVFAAPPPTVPVAQAPLPPHPVAQAPEIHAAQPDDADVFKLLQEEET